MSDNYSIARYLISQLRPGLQLGETVLSPDGKVLLYAGTILTEKHIEKLSYYNCEGVRVRELQSGVGMGFDSNQQRKRGNAEPEELIVSHEYYEADMAATVSEQETEFAGIYGNVVKDLKRCFTIVRLEKHLDCELLQSIVDALLTLSERGIGATALLHTATRSEDYLFHHSVNVGILANIIGNLSGAFKPSQQRNLILAGILHDIGKLEIPVHVLYKKGSLDEDELHMVRQHPAIAFKFFRRFKEIPESVRLGVLQHHERDDGSGYPLQTAGAKNHPIAKVLGIADVYDAMTSKKVYGEEVSPFAALDTIQADSFSGKFSPKYSTPFLHELCQTLIGRYVTLNDGSTGQLVFWNRSGKETCLIRFSDGQVIDIMNQNKLKVIKLVC
ncbi:HD-GYP domain-containing protein [Sporomusa sp. KB1]|uniref:HD-GYP domain-containing protein n=1 Tax=Sporomusa sp. KB1 TaxID=943346 RepID=UPI0011AC4CE9|nr:HD domain-containing phosphohydrolase [Sporomusa sp. KB1]TWH48029.1 HD-GYP domain-containing protein (c-di-GMP phosphodiesterase class II) [Sporomusa sp. KB1]